MDASTTDSILHQPWDTMSEGYELEDHIDHLKSEQSHFKDRIISIFDSLEGLVIAPSLLHILCLLSCPVFKSPPEGYYFNPNRFRVLISSSSSLNSFLSGMSIFSSCVRILFMRWLIFSSALFMRHARM